MESERVNILLVDDQLPNLLALEAILGDLGENLVKVQSGKEALRFLLDAEAAVILMDVFMPQLDGLETARLIRERNRTRHTPIIFLTAHDQTDAEQFHGYSLGAVDFLLKPLVPAILRAKVATFVELHRRIRRVQHQEGLLRQKQHEEHQRALAEEKQRWELERLHERSRQQQVIVELGQQALEGMELTDLFRGVVTRVGQALGVEACVVLELSADGDLLQVRAGAGWDESWTARLTSKDLPLLPELPLLIEDFAQDQRARSLFPAAPPLASGVTSLIPGSKQPFGLLGAFAAKKRAFTQTEGQFLEAVANVLATAILRKNDEAALRESSRRKDEFLAVLGHELRNPLAPIRNALHILRRPGLPPETGDKALEMADRQTSHLSRLVDDLLDLSRITRGQIRLQKESVNLTALVNRVVEATYPLVQQHRHELEVHCPPGPLLLHADPVRLEQILTNLLSNAVKYTNPGGHITLVLEHQDDQAILHVRDNGIGIAPEVLPRIFDLFMQAERYLDRSQGGLGIGLTLVRSLVELHGGSVTASSPGLGKGTEFVLCLPLAAGLPAANGSVAVQPAPVACPRRRMLVVDDNIDAASSLAVLLRMQGHEVEVVHNGQAALQTAQSLRPEVILLDIGLPDMTGYEVARRLRQLEVLAATLIVAVSGYTPTGAPEQTTRDIDRYLIKPLDLDGLLQLIAEKTKPASPGQQ